MTDIELGAGKTCFIVSPIGDALAPLGSPGRTNYEQSISVWSKVFEPACQTFGLTPIRADKIAEPGEIPNQIFTHLRDSDVVIADLSGANPNVMYELGLRHSRPGITLQIGEYERLPFDVTTIRTIQFVRDEAGLIEVRDKLIESLRAALTAGPTELRATAVFSGSLSGAPANVVDDARLSAIPDEDVEADDPGVVEILAEGEEAVVHITQVLEDTSGQITEVGTIVQEAGAELHSPAIQARGFAGRLVIVRRLADSLAAPAAAIEASGNEFALDVQRIDAMVAHIIGRVRRGEEDGPEARQFLAQIVELAASASEGAVGITTMRDGSSSLRRLSSSLRDVSRTLERGLDRLLEGIRVIQGWRKEIEALE